MGVELNHMIIPVRDKWASARFLAEIVGLKAQHYAFLVSDTEFDAALARIRSARITYFADFRRELPGEINHLYGGRGIYFDDPNGHLLELITRPYGPTPER